MYCRYCGHENIEGASFCKECGKSFIKTETVTSVVSAPIVVGMPVVQKGNAYAGFWIRCGAYFIDLALMLILVIFIVAIFGTWNKEWDSISSYVGLILYNTLFLSLYSTTPGKKLFGLKVVGLKSNENIDFKTSLVRSLSYMLSSLVLGIGFLQIAFDKDKHLAWHDKIAGTAVLKGTYNKTLAVILSVLSVLFYFWLIAYGYSDTNQDSPYSLQTGTREIKNQLNLNRDLFKDLMKDTQEAKDDKTQPLSDASKTNYKFNANKELAAVVMVVCPNDKDERDTAGSGTIISESGLILTNYHVVESSNKYLCEIAITNDISKEPVFMYYASLEFLDKNNKSFYLYDKDLDVAILQIIDAFDGYSLPSKFPKISAIGSSDALNINDKVFVAGYPSYGSDTITFTDGVVSGRAGDNLIKTSAKIDFGNSGGAAFNENGEYIGIPSLVAEGGLEGMGYILGIDSINYWLDNSVNSIGQ